jgi:3',5'-cyclic AMP phosphodiesterase CpdA
MVKGMAALALAAVAVAARGQTPSKPGAPSEITIGIIGDQTGTNDIATSYEVLKRATKLLLSQHVDAVIHTGDLVESIGAPERIRAEFQQATTMLDSIGKPWHLAPGDHDVDRQFFSPIQKTTHAGSFFTTCITRESPVSNRGSGIASM